MTTGATRLIPFLVVSIVVHTIVYLSTEPESPMLNAAPTGEGREVAIRLEAPAPADAGAGSMKAATGTPEDTIDESPRHEPRKKKSRARHPAQDRTASRSTAEHNAEHRDSRETGSRPGEPSGDEQLADTALPEALAADPLEQARTQRTAPVDDNATGRASTSSRASRSNVRDTVVSELARHFRYPRLARRRGWEGTVVLTVRILPDGRVTDIAVKESSGHAVLDRSAASALGEVERLPQFAERLGSEGLALEIPVTYRLESA